MPGKLGPFYRFSVSTQYRNLFRQKLKGNFVGSPRKNNKVSRLQILIALRGGRCIGGREKAMPFMSSCSSERAIAEETRKEQRRQARLWEGSWDESCILRTQKRGQAPWAA